jgi:hypothetical protein
MKSIVLATVSALATLAISSPAYAVRERVVPARVGYPIAGNFAVNQNCFQTRFGDPFGSVSIDQTQCYSAGWSLPIEFETRTAPGTNNMWVRIETGAGVSVPSVTFSSFYENGVAYATQSLSNQTTGKISYSLPVPASGYGAIQVWLNTYYSRIISYGYEYDF